VTFKGEIKGFLTTAQDGWGRATKDEGEVLAHLLVSAGEPRRRRLAGNGGGGQTLGWVAAARAQGNLCDGEARLAGGEHRWTVEGCGSARTRRSHWR
jgi:hypothetical protein